MNKNSGKKMTDAPNRFKINIILETKTTVVLFEGKSVITLLYHETKVTFFISILMIIKL